MLSLIIDARRVPETEMNHIVDRLILLRLNVTCLRLFR